ncbi:M4 family metallopeptidase [Spongiivirga sp. MCCC 1A20706]|uniref:M4 family metallopeptidase n=1 Tax=Spongiivirga sp. MCCC 1A20706 TaxID=3160963 RepID=UPI003977882E
MKKSICILLILFGFISSIQAQNPFLSKKRTIPNTGINPTFKNFNYQAAKSSPGKRTSVRKNTNTSFTLTADLLNVIQKGKTKKARIVYGKNGQPIFIKSEPQTAVSSSKNVGTPHEIASTYLHNLKPILKLKNNDSFELVNLEQDKNGATHLKYQQYHQGIKVFGQQVIVHLNTNNQVVLFNGHSIPNITEVNTNFELNENKALQIVEKDIGTVISKIARIENGHLMTEQAFKPEPIIYKGPSGKLHVAYQVEAYSNYKDRWIYYVDGKTGEILDKVHATCTIHNHHSHEIHNKVHPYRPPTVGSGQDLNGVTRQVGTYETNGTQVMVDTSKPMFDGNTANLPDNGNGVLMTLDLRNEPLAQDTPIYRVTNNSNNWNNPTAISAQYNADVSYEYFRNTHNRNSINGQGGTIISFINVADDDGSSLQNAFWNGRAMFYGNGGTAFAPLAGGLDVGGHEMSHGVIQNTANLEYQGQSGSINESFADIFGAMIDRDDWLIGEDVVNPQVFVGGALRNMQNPNNGGNQLGDPGWQPKDMNEFYTGTENNGGVHINSGIVNRAYYLIATDIGKSKAEQIYYRALTRYLTVSSQFIDLRLSIIQSATDLHGNNSPEVNAAIAAFDTVGITDGNPTDTDEDLPPLIGEQFILVAASETNATNTLFITDENAQNFTPISSTGLFRKPTVRDDGLAALFVTSNNTINFITLDPNNPQETEVSGEPLWGAIAVSKDGNRLAVTLKEQRNSIFILDLEGGTNREFQLYNPTTSTEGNTTGEVLYPDALEWDYTGEYLIYDAFNRVTNINGSIIDYWDVGVLKAWDNNSDDYGDGTIQKLFTNLPDGVSIGNPSLSKTSNNILAFDFFNANTNEYLVLTADIERNEVQTIWNNLTLGFPNYAVNDRQLIFDGEDTSGTPIIASINIQADRISPDGSPQPIINNGKWGIWYTQGEREAADGIPSDNFLVKSTGESCLNSNNGSISISVKNTSYTYNAFISGNGLNENRRFNNQTAVNNLQAGTYSVCITIDELPNQEYCFDVVIVEPTPLSVSARLDTSAKTVKLNLSGGKRYTIQLNNQTFETQQSTIEIPLRDEVNKLIVSTDKNCQGVYEETFLLNNMARVYPNPTKSGFIFINLPQPADTSEVIIYNLDGTLIKQFTFNNPTNQPLKIPVDELISGVYMVQVKASNHTSSHKIIKQ